MSEINNEVDDFFREEETKLLRQQVDILRGLVDGMVTTQAVRVALEDDGLDPDRVDEIVASIDEIDDTMPDDVDA